MKENKILIYVFQLLTGLIFLLTGFAKLYPIEPFELTFLDSGLVSFWAFVPFLSRLIIAASIAIGFMLVLNQAVKKTLKFALVATVISFAYSLFLFYSTGREYSTGFMGSFFTVTPVFSLILNSLLILAVAILLKIRHQNFGGRWWLHLIILAVALALPFILNPVQLSEEEQAELDFELNRIPDPVVNGDTISLKKGKKILAFYLVNCPHCKRTAKMLRIADKQGEIPETIFVIAGDPEGLNSFRESTHTNFTYVQFKDEYIFRITNGRFPTIMLVNDGEVEDYWTGRTFTYNVAGNLVE